MLWGISDKGSESGKNGAISANYFPSGKNAWKREVFA
jgi:hypothetical protein